MTPTRPVFTDDHFQAQNADKWIEANDGLRALFEAHQNSMRLLVEALRNPPAVKEKNIGLPEFHPENADTDARAWLATADICLPDRDIQGSKLILIILNKAMKGSAATWLSQIAFS
ncbi:unnamed protein product [Parnassius apollo]|uniref:(apollo) hypothetical protein n=1 Tax=Parnassius apollo TaxID=110799 RepID=A0A8S3WB53_PARAO|nr:unnamed protein product [Parnassius apollo]